MARARDFRGRAATIFHEARGKMDAERKTLHRRHSATSGGGVNSGALVRGALAIFESQAGLALDQVHGEAAKIIEHRGRAWRAAMRQIGEALDAEIGAAPETLGSSIRFAGPAGSDGNLSAMGEIEGAGERLKAHHVEFADGWTAPRAKAWRERHVAAYAILLIIVGAIVGQSVTMIAHPIVRAWWPVNS